MCIPSGGGVFGHQWDRAVGVEVPAPPPIPKTPAPPELPNQTAQMLGAAPGLRDAQALAARMGVNSLIIPFQSLNAP